MDKKIPDWETWFAWHPVRTAWGWTWLAWVRRRFVTDYMRSNQHMSKYRPNQKYIYVLIDD